MGLEAYVFHTVRVYGHTVPRKRYAWYGEYLEQAVADGEAIWMQAHMLSSCLAEVPFNGLPGNLLQPGTHAL